MKSFAVTGNQMRAARALAGVTQQDVADAAGVHVNSIRYWESKKSMDRSGYAIGRVENALRNFGVEFTFHPAPGVCFNR